MGLRCLRNGGSTMKELTKIMYVSRKECASLHMHFMISIWLRIVINIIRSYGAARLSLIKPIYSVLRQPPAVITKIKLTDQNVALITE